MREGVPISDFVNCTLIKVIFYVNVKFACHTLTRSFLCISCQYKHIV